MSYLTVSQFRDWPAGADLSNINDDNSIQSILDAASAIVDNETNTTWSYQTIVNEPKDWGTGRQIWWQTTPYFAPIRMVNDFFVAASLDPYKPGFYQLTIPVTPVGPPGITPPTNFGQVYVDRARHQVKTTYTMLQIGIAGAFFPVGQLEPPQIMLSYTAGYDDPTKTTQDDGLSFPIPAWLSEATRQIAAAIVNEANLNSQGLAGIMMVRQGQSEFRRFTSREGDPSFSIPDEVRRILRTHRKTALVGGSL